MENREKILEAMKNAGEPLNNGKIVELTGLEKKDVEKAMKQLKAEEKIVSPKRCYWQPK
ncbi:MarR family transcriptional regulator [Turicibacter sanguinis]|uniref:MarR family transcriptional regulator n=1 Tax=Turicibacter sanguinis TaxID=154288 RepID=UPI0018A99441|nr:MarR family transcriptional regulator [Turicibacter sanguinis]MDB8552194.1 MarR family transcriptional regulator [Turicibacter sanguinis]